MRMEKKTILKDDGRYLIYYHFAESATPEQKAAFDAVTPAQPGAETTAAPASPVASGEGKPHV